LAADQDWWAAGLAAASVDRHYRDSAAAEDSAARVAGLRADVAAPAADAAARSAFVAA